MKKDSFIRINVNDIIMILLGIFTCIFLVVSVEYKSVLINYYIHILLICIILLLSINIKKVTKRNKKELLIFLIEVVILFLSVIKNNGGFGSIEFIVTTLLIFIISDKIVINKFSINFIGIINTIAWVYLVFNNLNNLNTNVASYQIYIAFLIMLPFLKNNIKSNLARGVIVLSVFIIMLLSSLKYDCRTVLVSTLLLFIFNIMPMRIWENKRIIKIIFFIITFGSLIIVGIYLYLYNNGINIDTSLFSSKKFFSGREVIWNYMINEFMNNHIILGIGSNFMQYGFSNIGIHNYMLNILIVFGICNFGIYLYILYQYMQKAFLNEKMCKQNIIYLLEIITIFLIEFFETHLISAYALVILMFLSVFYYNIDKIKKGE